MKVQAWLIGLATVCLGPGQPLAKVASIPPQPGYRCQVGKAFDDATWGSATLDASGKLVNAEWTWRTGGFRDRYLLYIGSGARGGSELDDGAGATAFVSWNEMPDARRRPAKRMVQLTSSAKRQHVWGAFQSGEPERSFTPTVAAAWSDLLAFAKGASAINLNLLDDKWRFLDSVAVDRSVILRADKEIKATVDALRARIANHVTECERLEDIVDRDIVV